MGYRSSGNLTVDAMGSIAISGNVIPEEWYRHIVKPTTGKPYLLAITILADLVYWHRPTEIRDERTGEVIGWKKKFHGEMLQKSYQEYANKFGESKKTIKLAFDQLVAIGVIRRFFYNIEYSNGRIIPNQMFIDLNIKILKDISYPSEEGGATGKKLARKLVKCGDNCEETPVNSVLENTENLDNIYGQNANDMVTNLSGYPDNNSSISYPKKSAHADENETSSNNFEMGYPTDNLRTNTYTTTNINYRDHIISINHGDTMKNSRYDEIDGIRKKSEQLDRLIKSNINYDWHMENDDITRKDDFHELYLIIHDVICGEHMSPIVVNKMAMDPELVKQRYLQLNDSHLEYVIDRLHDNPNLDGIRDIRSYMITCLYNAPATIGQFYQQWVNHDSSTGSFT
ncbi:MAG: DUF6017 domain-containing protein [Lachnospiraceae bacterium]|nr:DUF6017 domain-containing protein [Lachnospiraceae bacterium]